MKPLLAAALLFSASLVFACTCAPPPPNLHTRRDLTEWSVNRSSTIFEGKVEKVELKGWPPNPEPGKTALLRHDVQVTFSGIRAYRGHMDTSVVHTGMGGGDCGYKFEVGETYLVYAGTDQSGQPVTSICSGTAPIEDSGPALRLLRGEPPDPKDVVDLRNEPHQAPHWEQASSRICGRAVFPNKIKGDSITVYLWHAGSDPLSVMMGEEIYSEDNGSFCTEQLEPGNYILGAQADAPGTSKSRYIGYYPGTANRERASSLNVTAANGVAHADFQLVREPLYKVRGYLRGLPQASDREIQIFIMSRQIDAIHMVEPKAIGPHGSFEVSEVPPGHYMVFAAYESEAHEGAMVTYVSSVANLDITDDVDGLRLDYVPEK